MKKFVKFMVSNAGRGLRIAVGLILIIIGLFAYSETKWALVIIGLVPLLAGVFDLCLIAPLFGYYISGKKTREKVNAQ